MTVDPQITALLHTLRRRLAAVEGVEIGDTHVRESMYLAVLHGFIRAEPDYTVPYTFGMYTLEADDLIREAIVDFIDFANQRAAEIGLADPQDRLAAFQAEHICEDYFGASE